MNVYLGFCRLQHLYAGRAHHRGVVLFKCSFLHPMRDLETFHVQLQSRATSLTSYRVERGVLGHAIMYHELRRLYSHTNVKCGPVSREELERENKLREQVVTAMGWNPITSRKSTVKGGNSISHRHETKPGTENGSETAIKTTDSTRPTRESTSDQTAPNDMPPRAPLSAYLFQAFFWGMLVVLLYDIFQSAKDTHAYNLPLWMAPPDVCARWLLLSLCHPASKVKLVREEYETMQKTNPLLTFADFLASRYPTLLQGRAVSQDYAVYVLSHAVASEDTFLFRRLLLRTPRGKESMDRVDDLISRVSASFPPPPPNFGTHHFAMPRNTEQSQIINPTEHMHIRNTPLYGISCENERNDGFVH